MLCSWLWTIVALLLVILTILNTADVIEPNLRFAYTWTMAWLLSKLTSWILWPINGFCDKSSLRCKRIDCSTWGHAQGCECEWVIELVCYLQNVSTNVVLEIDKTVWHIQSLVRQFKPSDRQSRLSDTRGLSDFIRELSHSLFCTGCDKT